MIKQKKIAAQSSQVLQTTSAPFLS